MKSSFAQIGAALAAGALALALASPASAQQSFGMKVYVPFSFLAGDRAFPAADYWVRVDQQFHVVEVRAAGETAGYRILLNPSTTERKGAAAAYGALRFAKYGSTYALRGVWDGGATDGYELMMSNSELQLAKAVGGSATGEAGVTIH